MCTGEMAKLYYWMNRVTANQAGKKFSEDTSKPIACNAAPSLAAIKQKRQTDQPGGTGIKDGPAGRSLR